MTKKVLISLEHYANLFAFDGKTTDEVPPDCPCSDCINYITFKKWFDAQKDIKTILQDAKKDFLKQMKCAKAQRRILAGVHEDDN